MRRIFPSPLLSGGLFVLWLLLMQSLDRGTVLLGLVLAVLWPAVTARLRPLPVRVRRPVVMLRLLGRVIAVMLRSNVEVAHAILTRRGNAQSKFVLVPLELSDPNGLSVLAMIITFTPGTAWVQLSADRRLLLLHVLTPKDEDALVRHIKTDFETPLREIFQS